MSGDGWVWPRGCGLFPHEGLGRGARPRARWKRSPCRVLPSSVPRGGQGPGCPGSAALAVLAGPSPERAPSAGGPGATHTCRSARHSWGGAVPSAPHRPGREGAAPTVARGSVWTKERRGWFRKRPQARPVGAFLPAGEEGGGWEGQAGGCPSPAAGPSQALHPWCAGGPPAAIPSALSSAGRTPEERVVPGVRGTRGHQHGSTGGRALPPPPRFPP